MRRNVVLVIMICIGFFYLHAEEEKDSSSWGFIFNTNSLLLDIESYQAGMGFKTLHKNDVALRYLVDIFYANSYNTFSGTLGITYEKHFKPGRISPYWGGFIEAGYMSQKEETEDSDYWTEDISYPFSVGAVLGVEFFILEFLSVFAEYSLYFDGTRKTTSTSIDGDITETDPDFSYSIDSGIGNNSSLGVVIYLDNVIDLKKEAVE